MTTITHTLTDLLAWLSTRRKSLDALAARRFASLLGAGGTSEPESHATSEYAQDLPRATLRITSGLHRGACVELSAREYVIGSGEDCDIVLRDPMLARRHCRLTREWSGFTLRDLQNENSRPIAPQAVNYHGAALEAVYDIGGVVVTLLQHPPEAADAPSGDKQAQPRYPSWVLCGFLSAGLLLAIVTFAATHRSTASASASVTERIATGSPALAARSLDSLLEQVRHTLAAENLEIGVHDGRLRIAGTTHQADVKDRIRSLTDDLRGLIAVEDGVAYVAARGQATDPGPFPVRLRGVMIGAASYFLTDTGARYFVGGVLPDGAEVLSIEASRIRFRRAGEVVVYDLE